MSGADLFVETLSETFEIDIGRIHEAVKFLAWFFTDVAGGHGNRWDSMLMACLGYIDSVFEKDDRIIIGEGNTTAAEFMRCFGNSFRSGTIGQSIHFP